MGKLKGPIYNGDFEKWRKLITIWTRSLDEKTTNDEIVSAVILGLNQSSGYDEVVDIVLDLDQDELYPDESDYEEMSELEEKPKTEPATPLSQEEQDAQKEEEKKKSDAKKQIPLKKGLRKIPGLNAILIALKEKYGTREEEKLFSYYEEFESLKRDKAKTMNDYIIKFESILRKLTKNKVVIPDIILAYRLLNGL